MTFKDLSIVVSYIFYLQRKYCVIKLKLLEDIADIVCRAEWPKGLRRFQKVGKFPVQLRLGGWPGKRAQPRYDPPGDLPVKNG